MYVSTSTYRIISLPSALRRYMSSLQWEPNLGARKLEYGSATVMG